MAAPALTVRGLRVWCVLAAVNPLRHTRLLYLERMNTLLILA
jgi:hypothetical protein